MKSRRPCINFYIKSFSGSANTVISCLWKLIVESHTPPRFMHLIGNLNI